MKNSALVENYWLELHFHLCPVFLWIRFRKLRIYLNRWVLNWKRSYFNITNVCKIWHFEIHLSKHRYKRCLWLTQMYILKILSSLWHFWVQTFLVQKQILSINFSSPQNPWLLALRQSFICSGSNLEPRANSHANIIYCASLHEPHSSL